AHIAKYRICKELLSSYEPHSDIPFSTDPQIGPSSISSINISSPTLLDSEFQESFLPNSDDEKTIMNYSAPDIENKYEEEFEHIDNLDNSFGWILIWILRYQQRYQLSDTAKESL
ncbi:9073_t:CDS:2, partial [Dentiscutata heterogama]